MFDTIEAVKRLANKKAGEDFAMNDEIQTNQVVLAKALLNLLLRI